MKVESVQYYDAFDCLICSPTPSIVFDMNFMSISDAVLVLFGTLSTMGARSCLFWLDNMRYIYLTGTTYDVHYHGHIDNLKKLMSK